MTASEAIIVAITMVLVRENNDKDDGRIWVNKYEFVE